MLNLIYLFLKLVNKRTPAFFSYLLLVINLSFLLLQSDLSDCYTSETFFDQRKHFCWMCSSKCFFQAQICLIYSFLLFSMYSISFSFCVFTLISSISSAIQVIQAKFFYIFDSSKLIFYANLCDNVSASIDSLSIASALTQKLLLQLEKGQLSLVEPICEVQKVLNVLSFKYAVVLLIKFRNQIMKNKNSVLNCIEIAFLWFSVIFSRIHNKKDKSRIQRVQMTFLLIKQSKVIGRNYVRSKRNSSIFSIDQKEVIKIFQSQEFGYQQNAQEILNSRLLGFGFSKIRFLLLQLLLRSKVCLKDRLKSGAYVSKSAKGLDTFSLQKMLRSYQALKQSIQFSFY